MKSSNKKSISKEEAFDLLLEEYKDAFSDTDNRSFSCRENYSFHINPGCIGRDEVTERLYAFSKRYSIEDGLFYVVPESETIFKIV